MSVTRSGFRWSIPSAMQSSATKHSAMYMWAKNLQQMFTTLQLQRWRQLRNLYLTVDCYIVGLALNEAMKPRPLSVHFNGYFPCGTGLAGTGMSPFWILLALRMMEMVVTTGAISRAKLQSNRHHQLTNTQLFYRPDALHVAKPTVSEHWGETETMSS